MHTEAPKVAYVLHGAKQILFFSATYMCVCPRKNCIRKYSIRVCVAVNLEVIKLW